MPNIQINIKNKVARADRVIIVCDNSDYTAVFDFDDEWSAYDTKTARFVYGGTYTDVVFTGNSCPIPEIHDSRSLSVGVYAGDLHTTTPAYISCVPSILCGNGIPADPTPDVYAQIMELLNKESGIWYPAVDDAGNMSWTRSMSETEPQPVNIKGPKGDAGVDGVGIPGADGKDGVSPSVSVAAITGGNRVTITDVEGTKTFDVMDGAQGASGADGKDYVLTNTDKQEIAKTAAGLVDVPSVQPDWNQNDSTQPDYIKNRPFYTGNPVETVLVEESTVTFAEDRGLYVARFPSTFAATVGETYKVYWDGAAYECTCVDFRNMPVIGNLSIVGSGSDTGEPFLMVISNGEGIEIVTADTSASHTISISDYYAGSVVKIDQKYLPVASETEPGIISITPLYNYILQQVHNEYFMEIDTQVSGYGDKATIKEYANKNNSRGIFSSGKFGGAVLSCHDTANKHITFVLSGGKNIECWKFSQGSTTMERLWGISEDGVVISSSTAGSTKKFRITVDDSGTITATEVT